jgi:streptomycin 6-kinase
MFAERACDLAVPMREWNADLLAGDTVTMAQERCALLSRLTGVDPVAIWEWGFLERLSTGLFASQLGYSGAAAFLEVAERLTDDRACG